MASITCEGIAFIFVSLTCELPPQPTTIVCPPLVEWRATDQKAAGAALKALPPGHPLRKMAIVATKQRDVVKECERQRSNARAK